MTDVSIANWKLYNAIYAAVAVHFAEYDEWQKPDLSILTHRIYEAVSRSTPGSIDEGKGGTA